MEFTSLYIAYQSNTSTRQAIIKGNKTWENEDIKIEAQVIEKNKGEILSIKIFPKKEIHLKDFSIEYPLNLDNKKMLINGFQTWTQSKEMGEKDILKDVHILGNLFGLKPYGDYLIHPYKEERGRLHSFTYTYFRGEEKPLLLLGSIDEGTGYTVFEGDYTKNTLTIKKDCEGVRIKDPYTIMQIYMGQGEETYLWDDYFSYIPNKRANVEKVTGWTSWYNYYTNITEEIILKNIKGMKKETIPIEVFQIDDGYQNAVGDWLIVNKKFPSGMDHLADKIKEADYRPGLWLAPFICEKKSQLYKDHYDWVLKDSKGHPVKAGWNPGWSGTFYAMDFYNKGFRDYLKKVFETVLDQWGYQMVKLDFLYAVALLPQRGKSRGQIMTEAMDFLMEVIGNRWILGCGVPLGAAFGRVDYCRIGSDVAPYWEDNKLKILGYRERVSTINSLYSTLSRYQLNERAFYNDPDVFILRKEKNKMTKAQNHTLFILNNLLGGLIFTSDDIEDYDSETMRLYRSMFPKVKAVINRMEDMGGWYKIDFTIENRSYILFSNLTKREVKIPLGQGRYFNQQDFIVEGNQKIQLREGETKCYYRINNQGPLTLIGTSGHLFPGSEIKKIEDEGGEVTLSIKDHAIVETEIYIELEDGRSEIIVNGDTYYPEDIKGHQLVKVRCRYEN